MNNFIVLLGLITLAQANVITKSIDKIGKGITKEIVAVKNPIESGVLDVVTTQCDNVKKLFGISYEQLDGKNEPDPNALTLNYITKDLNITLNILHAAELITQSKDFDKDQHLIVYMHGFTDEAAGSSFTALNNAFRSIGEYNILALDGKRLLKWLYVRSTTYVRFIGEYLGKTLAAMANAGVDPANMHIIGHSLGAHISGFAGKTFTNLTGLQVSRISGLDPAGPCFSQIEANLRLKASDAEYVDVIHTDAGVYGMFDPLGDVDYYPNSGAQQPGCLQETCSHSLAWKLYGESITDPEAFPAVKCNDWEAFKKGSCSEEISYMGYGSKNSQGKFYLNTRDSSPYSLGPQGTTYTNNEAIINKIFG